MRNKILPANEASLRIHGNGFLQAETRCGNKLHIWDKRLPCQKVPTFKHNHNHGFTSVLLIGDLQWTEFTTYDPFEQPGPTLGLFQPHQCIPREGKDTKLEPVGPIVAMSPNRQFLLKQGSMYEWPLDMNLYHHVDPIFEEYNKTEQVISFVKRGQYCEDLPTVLVGLNEQPDNDFDRYAHDEIARVVYEHAVYVINLWFK